MTEAAQQAIAVGPVACRHDANTPAVKKRLSSVAQVVQLLAQRDVRMAFRIAARFKDAADLTGDEQTCEVSLIQQFIML